MTGELLNDSVETLQDVVDRHGGVRRLELTTWIEVARNFLKVQYDEHAIKEDDRVPCHGIQFGLRKPVEDDSGAAPRQENCPKCAFVPFLFNQLHAVVPQDDGDCHQVLRDVQHKFSLFQAHRLRVINQQVHIAALAKRLKRDCDAGKPTTEAILLLDFKMKFEERSARETTKEHYAKRGMSWHGVMIQYFVREPVKQQDGSFAVETCRKLVYLDQIIAHGNDQSAATVMSCIEAALKSIHHHLPFIRTVSLQSDNAKCYNNNDLRLFLLLLNTQSPVNVVRYIFTETQDGKGTCCCVRPLCTQFVIPVDSW